MLQPKRTKYRKQQKKRNKGLALRGSTVDFGTYGLKAITRGRLTSRQIEAARIASKRSRYSFSPGDSPPATAAAPQLNGVPLSPQTVGGITMSLAPATAIRTLGHAIATAARGISLRMRDAGMREIIVFTPSPVEIAPPAPTVTVKSLAIAEKSRTSSPK